MALKKPTLTAKALQALLTQIGSASSGTKSDLQARFQRDIKKSGLFSNGSNSPAEQLKPWGQKLRIVSIDMGIKNLAFCDAEISYPTSTATQQNLNATMNVLRWQKIDLVKSARFYDAEDHAQNNEDATGDHPADDLDPFSLSVLSRTAHKLITNEILHADPDIILIEKQRWRSGGGSAIQQWTVRVNTLEAMLWAILETLKQDGRITADPTRNSESKNKYRVYAVDPKRVGQYWLGQHARALQERNDISKSPEASPDANAAHKAPSPTRTNAEKRAKISLLRSWLAHNTMSTTPSTPSSTPHITFTIHPAAAPTLHALLPKPKAPKTSPPTTKTLMPDTPAPDTKKLDDITDCFLQAAAWVAWESNRLQLVRACGCGEAAMDEARILEWLGR